MSRQSQFDPNKLCGSLICGFMFFSMGLVGIVIRFSILNEVEPSHINDAKNKIGIGVFITSIILMGLGVLVSTVGCLLSRTTIGEPPTDDLQQPVLGTAVSPTTPPIRVRQLSYNGEIVNTLFATMAKVFQGQRNTFSSRSPEPRPDLRIASPAPDANRYTPIP